MSVARTGVTVANAGTGATTDLVINNPTGGTTVGNVIIINVGSNVGTGQTWSVAGFSRVTGFTPQSANALCFQDLFYRICDGTEGTTFTIHCTATQRMAAVATCYSGVDNANPFCGIAEQNNAATAGTTYDFPSTNVTASPAYGVLLIRSRNGTGADTVTTPSTGYSVAGDTTAGLAAIHWNQTATMDEHTDYTGTPTYAIDPANATIGPNNALMVMTVLFLKPVGAGANKGSFFSMMGA